MNSSNVTLITFTNWPSRAANILRKKNILKQIEFDLILKGVIPIWLQMYM